MSDPTNHGTHTPPPPPPTPVPFPADSTPMSEKEVKEGKAFGVLCYAVNFAGIPFWLVPLIMRNNDFSLYHSKQCLMMWLLGLATGAVAWIPCAGWIVAIAVLVGLIVLNIIGLINALNNRCKPLPLLGTFAEKWFLGIRKVPNAA